MKMGFFSRSAGEALAMVNDKGEWLSGSEYIQEFILGLLKRYKVELTDFTNVEKAIAGSYFWAARLP